MANHALMLIISYFYRLTCDSITNINRLQFMHNQKERLQFYGSDLSTIEKSIGKNKQINPLRMVEDQQQPLNESNLHQFTGKFVNDVILADEGPIKGKKIIKPDKRLHYKTKMCPDGRDCRKKFTCTFAHTENELRKPFMKRKTPCVLYQMGKCQLDSACREYHGNMDLQKKNYKYKQQICKDFAVGKCHKGNVCIYIHQNIEDEDNAQKEAHIEAIQAEQIKTQKSEQIKPLPQALASSNKTIKKQGKKEIIEIVEEVIGTEEFVDDGLTFSFNFTRQ